MSAKRGHDGEDYDFKRKRVLSGIATEEDFKKAYPGYQFDEVNVLTEPNCMDKAGIRKIVASLAPALINCSRATKIDSESSRYPFVYEIIKFLVRLTGAECQIHAYDKQTVPSDELTMEAASMFVRESEVEYKDESLEEMIMRWERYFPTTGRDTFGYGYVEFSVESLIDKMVKYLLEVKKSLKRTSIDIRAANGFWQASGEAVAARIANIDRAGTAAYDRAVLEHRKQARPQTNSKYKKDIKAADDAWDMAVEAAGQAARVAAQQVAATQPVWVTLTDFNEWIFLRLEGNTIMASEAYRMFDFSREQLIALPTIVKALQFFCQAIGVRCSTDELNERIKAIEASDQVQASKFLESIYHDEVVTYCNCLKAMQATAADAKVVLLKEFPLVDASKYIDW